MNKKLYRSTTDSKISGVCGGLAVYFNVDSTLLRLLWVLVTFFSGIVLGIIMYIACVMLIPVEPDVYDAEYREK